jgi:rhamnosyltransferase
MSGAEIGRSMGVSVVIPVLNAEPYLHDLLSALFEQEPAPPEEVILVDSGSTDRTSEIAASFEHVRVVPIENFSHGRTRNLGAREAKADTVVLMTQDALPANTSWLSELLVPFEDAQVAATFSRQVARPGANPMEVFFLQTHFPANGPLRREKGDRAELGFPDVFFSNVSAAIRRDVLLEHPFDEDLIMSEDQQFARDVLDAGHATVYQPDSVVLHSHNYSLRTVFKRYFDSVHSLTRIFPRHGVGTSASIGLRYLARECRYVLRNHPLRAPHYLLYVMAKAFGTLAGHFVDYMPRPLVKRLSLHSYHWS